MQSVNVHSTTLFVQLGFELDHCREWLNIYVFLRLGLAEVRSSCKSRDEMSCSVSEKNTIDLKKKNISP